MATVTYTHKVMVCMTGENSFEFKCSADQAEKVKRASYQQPGQTVFEGQSTTIIVPHDKLICVEIRQI